MFGRDVVEAVEKKLKERDMPKGEFYKKSGISSATFSQWRNGTYEPSTENLSRIEECLGLSFAISQKEKQPAGSGELSEEETAMLDAFRTLPQQERALVMRLLRSYASTTEQDRAAPEGSE